MSGSQAIRWLVDQQGHHIQKLYRFLPHLRKL
jgi:hypothetical protein